MMKVGIDAITFCTSPFYLDLADLAAARSIDANKFYTGLGQYQMGVTAPDEDIVTLAANAAEQVLKGQELANIDTLFFATESGIDQSKAAGIYVHRLLGLPAQCRVIELKQACYSATAGLQMACAMLQRNPQKKILLIASDISRYGLNTPGESSQGCGAVAMLLSTNPRLLAIEAESGLFTQDIMDFWRPNYRDEALVEGHYSAKMYLQALQQSWQDYQNKSTRQFNHHDFYCYHTPVPRLVEKAHKSLWDSQKEKSNWEQQLAQLDNSLRYNRQIGNSYTAALYISLISLLENHPDNLAGKRIGLFSYGSGCTAEFFSGIVAENYREVLFTDYHQTLLAQRQALTYEDYEKFYLARLPEDGSEYQTPIHTSQTFRLAGIKQHQRIYEKKLVIDSNHRDVPTEKKSFTGNVENKLTAPDNTSNASINSGLKVISPGKIILSGEYSVVHGKPALAMAIDRFAETTITATHETANVSFELPNLKHKSSLPFTALRHLKKRVSEKYQQFLTGNCHIRDVLQTPMELAQIAAVNVLEQLNPQRLKGVNIVTQSDIPVGCGLGSSAATILSVLYALGQHFKLGLQRDLYLRLGKEAENLQHGHSSGLDLYISLFGGCIYFQNGAAEQRPLPQVPLYLVNTGTPSVSTGENVAYVNQQHFSASLWDEFEQVTLAMDQALLKNSITDVHHTIRTNQRLLTHIGVVPAKIQQFTSEIEKQGASAKVCGAGAMKGENAGAVLVIADNKKIIADICSRYRYEFSTLLGVEQGLRVA